MFDCALVESDPRDCPGPSCPANAFNTGRAAHAHCCVDGRILYEVGERHNFEDADGIQATLCADCDDPMCARCARAHPMHDGKAICRECDNTLYAKAIEQDLPVVNIQNADEDLKDSLATLDHETDPLRLEARISALRGVMATADAYSRALSVKISRVHLRALPGMLSA